MMTSVFLVILFSIPSVQNYAAQKASGFATQKIGAPVKIEKLLIAFPNKLRIKGLYVEDLNGDTLLYAQKVNVFMGVIPITPDGIHISSVRLQNGAFNLIESPSGVMNIKEVIDKISKKKKEKKGNFSLTIGDAVIDSLNFSLRKLVSRNPVYGVDYSAMYMNHLCTSVSQLKIKGSEIGGDIQSLNFTEVSGVSPSIKGRFVVDTGLVGLEDINIRVGNTNIDANNIIIKGESWQSYKDFIHNVTLDVDIRKASFDSDDVAYFAPKLAAWKIKIPEIKATFSGTVSDFKSRILKLRFADGGSLKADGLVRGLTDVKNTKFNIKILELNSSVQQLRALINAIARVKAPKAADPYISRIDRITSRGTFNGTISSFKAQLNTRVGDKGSFILDCSMDPRNGTKVMSAKLSAEKLLLGRLLASKILGPITCDIGATLILDNGLQEATVDGQIHRFGINYYPYENISLNSVLKDKKIKAQVKSNDENFLTEVKAYVDMTDSLHPVIGAIANIEKANLFAMNVNKRDSVSLLSCDVDIALVGKNLDEMIGEASITNATYQNDVQYLESDLITLNVSSNEDTRSIKIASDFMDATYESRCKYTEAVSYLKNILAKYVPNFFDDPQKHKFEKIAGDARNAAVISVTTKRLNELLSCITPGLDVAENTDIKLYVDPTKDNFIARAKSDFIGRNRLLATELDLIASNRGDSLAVTLGAKDMYVGTMHIPDLKLLGGVKNNRVHLHTSFADTVGKLDGKILLKANVTRPHNIRHISLGIDSSYVKRNDNIWRITTSGIDIDSARIDIRNFMVKSENEKFYVNGVASRSERDSVYIEMNNFSLSPFTQVAQTLGYNISGKTNGYANIHSALKISKIDANVDIDQMDVNGIAVPNLNLRSKWDFYQNRARLDIVNKKNGDTVVQGFYAPDKVRYYAEAKFGGVNIALIDPILLNVISDTKGEAEVDLVFEGQRNNANLHGDVVVRDLTTKLDFTNCSYSVPEARIIFKQNTLVIDKAALYDSEKNSGTISMNLALSNLSNIDYWLGVQFRNLKVMNTTEKQNDMFYGNIYGTGTVIVAGDKSGVQLDIAARTEDNSHFYMPLSSKRNISVADFVTFKKKSLRDTTNNLVKKKMLFEKQQNVKKSSPMDISLALDVRPNTDVQLVIDPTVGDIIKAKGSGMLNMRINPRLDIFEMYGDYTISEGSYLFTLQNIINKKFTLQSGSTIQWTGEPLDALLNIRAAYKVKASLQPLLSGAVSEDMISSRSVPVDCILNLSERLSHPAVSFDVELPSVDASIQTLVSEALSTPESKAKQFLYLLVSNSFIPETSGQSAMAGVSSAAVTGMEMLSTQLSNWLSSDDYNIVLRYRPKTENNFSNEVDFGFSKGLVNDRLLIEVEGNYYIEKDPRSASKSNFAGEAYITWLIDRAGTLRLKGFTHTIDRFDENQGLQETGLGIYYKEDFDNARDFKRRVINRFKRKKKLLQEQEERQRLRDSLNVVNN